MIAKSSTFYNTFRRSAVSVENGEFVKVWTFSFNGREYRVYQTKNRATKLTEIECRGNTIIFKNHPQNGFLTGMRTHLLIEKFRFQVPAPEKDLISLFVISGVPGTISGLDEGVFHSAQKPVDPAKISVMSGRAFKIFDPSV